MSKKERRLRVASGINGPDWEHIALMQNPDTGHLGVLVMHRPSGRIGLALNGGISRVDETEAA